MAEEKIVFNPDVEKQGMKPKSKQKKQANKQKAEEKAKPERQPFINQYGFLGISNGLREHLGLPKFGKEGHKCFVTIEFIENGFVVKKA